jgi:hypothetical protein
MHTFEPNIAEPDENSRTSVIRAHVVRFLSPPHRVTNIQRLSFSMFYTISHVFTLLNTLLYWAVLVPAGHGGFRVPKVPHHHHTPVNSTAIFYDPSKRHCLM